MKTKETILNVVGFIIILVLLIAFIYFGLIQGIKDYKNYNTYKNFCENNSNICYCNFLQCDFKTSIKQTCLNGNCSELIKDEDTLKLCDLAHKLNDKEILFKANC